MSRRPDPRGDIERAVELVLEAPYLPNPPIGRCCPDGYACAVPGRPGCLIDAALDDDTRG